MALGGASFLATDKPAQQYWRALATADSVGEIEPSGCGDGTTTRGLALSLWQRRL